MASTDLEANASLESVAELSRRRVHTVRYCLRKLQSRDVIRFYPFINVYPLGYTPYSLYFTVSPEGESSKDGLLRFLGGSPQVSWLAEIGGRYQYCATILGKNVRDAKNVIDAAAGRFGTIFAEKEFSAQVSFTYFHSRFLDPAARTLKPFLSWGPAEAPAMDQLDQQILSGLMHRSYRSLRELGQQLAIPNSTLDRRVKELQRQNVIAGFVYLIDTLKLGMQTFKLLLFLKGGSERLKQALFDYCSKHRSITTLIECCGSWDYEIGIEVEESFMAAEISRELARRFTDSLRAIEMLPQFKELKVKCFPFLPEPPKLRPVPAKHAG